VSHHEDDTLRVLADQYHRDPGSAGWFAVGAASQALEFGNVARAQEILNAARALNDGGEVQ
jgi:hypothetical protein